MPGTPSTVIKDLSGHNPALSTHILFEAIMNLLAHGKVEEPGITLLEDAKTEGDKFIMVFDPMKFHWKDSAPDHHSLNAVQVTAQLKKNLEAARIEGLEIKPISPSTPKLCIISPVNEEAIAKLSGICDRAMEVITEGFERRLSAGEPAGGIKREIGSLSRKVPNEFLATHLERLFDKFPTEFAKLRMALQPIAQSLSERYQQRGASQIGAQIL